MHIVLRHYPRAQTCMLSTSCQAGGAHPARRFKVTGASGGDSGGLAAVVSANIALAEGSVVYLVVGQLPETLPAADDPSGSSAAGGGGASYLFLNSLAMPLLVAGRPAYLSRAPLTTQALAAGPCMGAPGLGCPSSYASPAACGCGCDAQAEEGAAGVGLSPTPTPRTPLPRRSAALAVPDTTPSQTAVSRGPTARQVQDSCCLVPAPC